jgi:hypothetical protein
MLEDGFGCARSGDGVGMTVDEFPVSVDELVDARNAGVEFGGLIAGPNFGTIVLHLDDGGRRLLGQERRREGQGEGDQQQAGEHG